VDWDAFMLNEIEFAMSNVIWLVFSDGERVKQINSGTTSECTSGATEQWHTRPSTECV
jgi:hypothetical protein